MRWWALGAMGGLAALDLVGALLAKEYADRPRLAVLLAGIAVFALLFGLYTASMSVSDLWVVTFGWVVLLEVGVLLLDRFHFGTAISTRKLVLVCLLFVVQIALLLPDHHGEPSGRPADVSPTAAAVDE
jgi:hypothetical protein